MLFMAVLCMVLLAAQPVMAEEAITFGGTGELDGNKLTVTVSVDKGEAFSGQVNLAYDTSVVKLISASLGDAVKDADVTDINTEFEGKSVVAAGFADLETVSAGDILVAEFEVLGDEIPETILFPVTVTEWNNEEQDGLKDVVSNPQYDIVVGKTPETPTEKPTEEPSTGEEETETTAAGEKESGEETTKSNSEGLFTGDTSEIIPIVIVLVAALAVCVILVFVKKKTGKTENQ